MRRSLMNITRKQGKMLMQRLDMQFGSHAPQTVQVDFNPDNLTVYKDDIKPEDIEQFRDMVPANRPSNKRTVTDFLEKTSCKLIKNRYLVDFLSTNLGTSQDEKSSEYIHPARLNDNSVFICQAGPLGSAYRSSRALEGFVAGAFLLFSPFSLFYSAVFVGGYVTIANFAFYEPSRRIVLRMDLLPNLEMISVQRLAFNGTIYNKLYNISSLQKVNVKDLMQNENLITKANRFTMDMNLVFKDKDTGDILYFDQNTIWSKEGLEHPLIN